MKALRAGRKTWAIIAIAFGFAVAASLLPDVPYQRWQLLDGTIHARARWIYERVHYDPTPIDIVFIGPSRIGAAVSAPQLSRRLAAAGLPSRVVNFSLPETGRDINALIFDETLKKKRPKLVVIGVIEKPSRYGHPAFKYIAPAGDLARPHFFGSISYLPDLIYLPYRQMELFTARIMPSAMGLSQQFDAGKYPGSMVETTGDVILPDGTVKNGTAPASAAELARGVAKLEGGMTPPLLGPALADVEFGDERYYVRHIVAAARAHGVRVAFLALPYYTGPSSLQEEALYRSSGQIWNAGFLASHPEWYGDYGHLTSTGAAVLTDWLVRPVSAELQGRP